MARGGGGEESKEIEFLKNQSVRLYIVIIISQFSSGLPGS